MISFSGLVSVTEALLSRGASVEVADSKGLTPILACAPSDEVVICMAMMMQVHHQSSLHSTVSSASSLFDLSNCSNRRVSNASSSWKHSHGGGGQQLLTSCAEAAENDLSNVENKNSEANSQPQQLLQGNIDSS